MSHFYEKLDMDTIFRELEILFDRLLKKARNGLVPKIFTV